jgi:hypothetical protein
MFLSDKSKALSEHKRSYPSTLKVSKTTNDLKQVVDPDWFNTDPDPAFLLNPDPDPEPDPDPS